MKYFLGIDIGTSAVKALMLGQDGETVGISKKEYEMIKSEPHYAEQSMAELWESTFVVIRNLIAKHSDKKKDIYGLSFSGQMHGLVMLDKDGNEVRNSIIWADQRSEESIKHIYDRIPKEEYEALTLNRLSTGFLISSLIWIKENEPENYEKIVKVMLPKDYIRYKICGEIGTDVSDASGTGIFDVAKREWAFAFMDRLGIDRSLFPACHETAEPAGTVSKEGSELTGLPVGTVVVYGGGDSSVQAVGNGIQKEGTAISNIGSASQLLTIGKSPFFDGKYRINTFCHAEPETWLIMGANLTGGLALKWLKGILDMNSYDEMTSLANEVGAGSNGVLFLPYLNGERTPWNDPNAGGVFLGLGLKSNRSDMIRAVMEGIIYAQKNSMEIFNEIGIKVNQMIASGGGAKSRLFRQMIADQLNCEVVTNRVTEQACVGAAMIAGVGTGGFESFSEACRKTVKFDKEVIEPVLENQKIYRYYYEVYKEIYPLNKELFIKLRNFSNI